MQIESFRRSFSIKRTQPSETSPQQSLAILNEQVRRQTKDSQFISHVREKPSPMPNLNPGWVYSDHYAEAVLLLSYNGGRDIPQLYQDSQSIDIPAIMKSDPNLKTLEYGETRYHEPSQVILSMDNDSHQLWYTTDIDFQEGNLEQQANQIIVAGIGDPSTELRQEIEQFCLSKDCSTEFLTSTLQTGYHGFGPAPTIPLFCMTSAYGGHTSNMRAPELEIRVKWNGEDFDKKAINLFGEIRKRLYPNHMETIGKYAINIVGADYRNSGSELGGISLNQERLNMGTILSNMRMHLSCSVPFTHQQKQMLANLRYWNFRGK